jgi:hypothetical protein
MFNEYSQLCLFDDFGRKGFIPNAEIKRKEILEYTLTKLRRGNDNPTRRLMDRQAVGRAMRKRKTPAEVRDFDPKSAFKGTQWNWKYDAQTQLRLFHLEEHEDFEFDQAIDKIIQSNNPIPDIHRFFTAMPTPY